MRMLRALVLCLASALLVAASAPPHNLWPLTFVAFVPLLSALERERAQRALFLGGVFGLLVGGLRHGFMFSVFDHFVARQHALAAVLSGMLFSIEAVRYGLLGLGLGLCARLTIPVWASFPALLLGAENVLRTLQPWNTGYTLGAAPVLAQAADLGGVALLTVLIGLVNALLHTSVVRARRKQAGSGRTLLFAACVIGLLAAYGFAREARVASLSAGAPGFSVGVIQANMKAEVAPSVALDAYEDQTVSFLRDKGRVDMLVWPETAVEFALEQAHLGDSLRAYVRLGMRVPDAPALLTGGLVQRRAMAAPENSAILVDEQRKVVGHYAKVNPMPFGEYLPLAGYLPFLHAYFPNSGSIAKVDRPTTLSFRGHRFQPRICYEEVLGDETREAVADNAPELFMDLVDDAWFGETNASSFHLAMARMRAIEHRRYLVRAVNDGPSAVIDARGHLLALAKIREPSVLVSQVRWLDVPSFYTRFGLVPAWLLAGLLVFASGGLRIRLRVRVTDESLPRSGRSA